MTISRKELYLGSWSPHLGQGHNSDQDIWIICF